MKLFDKYILRMSGFLVIISLFCFYSSEKIINFFSTNYILYSLIIFILSFGIIFLFRQVFILIPEIDWLNTFISKDKKSARTPVLLKPMSELMKTQTGKLILSQVGAIYTKISSEYPENLKTDFAPAYIESLIEITTENLKKSTSGIEKQNISQEKILRSLLEMNEFLNSNIEISKQMRDELKILSKTISNTLNKN